MFERLYNLLLLFKEYLILAGLVVLSLIFLSLNDNSQIKRIRAISAVALGMAQDQISFIPRYLRLREENEILRRVNVELADETSQLREAKLENARLRQLLGLKERSGLRLVAGKVVGKNLAMLRNTLTLGIGEADGVKASMPVMSNAGLVGVVISASAHYSVVNILLNSDFRASAKVQRSRVDGILAWNGTELTLKNITKTLDVRVGDVVITSDYSSTFPPNIRIGLVSTIVEQPGSLFKHVVIEPGVDFVKLEEVFVITALPDAERLQLESTMEETFGR